MSTPEQPHPPFPHPLPSNILVLIWRIVKATQEQVENLQTRVQLLAENENDVAVAVGDLVGGVTKGFGSLDARLSNLEAAEQKLALEADVQKLLDIFIPPPPLPAASIALTISQGEENMATAKKFGKMKLDMLPNGHLKATVAVNDDAGAPTSWDGAAPLAYSALDQAGRTDSLAFVPNADGTSCDIGPGANPPVAGDKIVITASGINARGTTLTADDSADPVNVKNNPAGEIVLVVTGA